MFRLAEKCKSCGCSYQRTELAVDPFALSAGWGSGGEDCFACTVPSVTHSCDPEAKCFHSKGLCRHNLSFVEWWDIGQDINLTLHPQHSPSSPSSHSPFIPPSTTIPTLPAALCRPGSSAFHVSPYTGGWMIITENIKDNYLLIRKANKPLHRLNAHK